MTELPEGWRSQPLGELVAVRYGKDIPKALRAEAGPYPIVGSAGVMSYTATPLTTLPAVLVGRKGNVGSVQLFRGGCHPVDTAYLLEVPDAFLPEFLHLQLISKNLKQLDSSTAVPSLRRQDLEAVEVVLPPLNAQQRIVETLEDQLSRLEKAYANVLSAEVANGLLLKSMRHEIFSADNFPSDWATAKVGDVLSPVNGKRRSQRGWSPQCLNHVRDSEAHWGVLKTTAIQLGDYQPQHHKQLPPSLNPKPEIEVQSGDIIMTATGPRNRCGIPCLVGVTPARLMMSGKMFRVRTVEEKCEPRWLLEFLLSPAGQSQLENLKVGSSDSSVSIGADLFERILLPLPPLGIQREILEQIDLMVERSRGYERAIQSTAAKFDLLRRSLLHGAFSGQLTNEVPND